MGKSLAVGLVGLAAVLFAVGCSSAHSDTAASSTNSAAVSGFPGCSGVFNKNPSPTGAYYATDFGCSSDPYFTDPGDTCGSAACIQSAYDQGVCTSSQSNASCQRAVNWYAVGGASYGCGARLQVSNPANGKSVVVMVLDNGPSCSVENDADFWVLDVSYPTIMYLFGSEEGWQDHARINAVQVAQSTPLGPTTGSPAPGGSSCTIDSGEQGTCIDTSACASMGGTSTPGFCPGADNIQCCTGVGGGSSQGDAGVDANQGNDGGGSPPPSQSNGQVIASIAEANIGLGACSTNSLGGTAYETSCDGNGGQPEYWCADFAQWVWQQAGANTDGLDAAAQSFYDYGQNNGTLSDSPAIGDAVVFNNGDGIHHVAIVTQVNSDGTIETVSGDWGGQGGSEAEFASTSQVTLNAPAYASTVGSEPSIMGMTIAGFISPLFDGSATPTPPPSCVVTTTGAQGICIDTSTCSSMGGTSTPDYCPGADNIQCCTGLASGP